jgi:hypothetical protein
MTDAKVIKYIAPNSSDWKPITGEAGEEESINAATKNRRALNDVLLSSMQMQNLVVLSGCGTSLGKDGGPSMWDLWELCTKGADEEYTKEAQHVFAAVNYDEKNQVNIEELLSLCEAHLQLNSGGNDDVRNFVEFCKDKILTACNFEKDDDFLSGHKTFIHRLSRRRTRDSRLKLFTTNYDTCFEEAAGEQGIVLIDGFSFTRPRHYDPRFFDYDIVRRTSDTSDAQSYLEGVFQLFKLHGSVNWERVESGNIEEREATPNGACMIFPAKGKYQQSYIQPHLELMARYLAALREPNTCLLVTGFGFNDDHLAEPIVSAIRTNPYLKVIISDPKAEEYLTDASAGDSRYWKELKVLGKKGQDVWFINATFQEFSELVPDLRSLTPAEKLAKNIQALTGGR